MKSKEELEAVFTDKPAIRDINVCKNCQHFHDHKDGTYGCGNVLKGHGHPWCAESYEPLRREWFEKAKIFIADKAQCLQK